MARARNLGVDPPGDPDTYLRLRTTDLCPTRAGGAPLNGQIGMSANLSLSNKQKESVGGTVHFSGAGCVFGTIPGFESLFSLDHFFSFYLKSCQVLNFNSFFYWSIVYLQLC